MHKKITNPEKPTQKKISNYYYLAFAIIIGIALGYSLSFIKKSKKEINRGKAVINFSEMRSGGYKFTNPLLDCDNFNASELKQFVYLKNNIEDYISSVVDNNTVMHISVYFRSLNDGPWIGVNENDNYTPASLLKVPILIAVLKKAETNKSLLTRKIYYSKVLDPSFKTNIAGCDSLRLGHSYTVNELLEFMIIHSDNNAKQILINLIGDDCLTNTISDLGVNLKDRNLSEDFVSAKEYSSFFRILYNSSYLNRNMSEKALEILSRTMYVGGIRGKLPKKIKVAHKFGERGLENSKLKQLHDCGIVYLPNNPYLLCVMTKGTDFENLNRIISDISEIVYNSVVKH